MYGFIEKKLAEILNINFTPFNFSDGSKSAIINSKDFNIIKECLDKYYEINPVHKDEYPEIIQSNVEGLYAILHWFYTNDSVLDNLVPGEVKQGYQYQVIASTSATNRFTWNDFFNKMKELYNEISGIGENNVVEETEVELVPVPEPVLIDQRILAIDGIKDVFRSCISSKIEKTSKDNFLFVSNNAYEEIKDFNQFYNYADEFDKNIIILSNLNHIPAMIKKIGKDKFEEYFLVISVSPSSHPEKYSRAASGVESLCLGYSIGNLYNINGSKTKEGVKGNRIGISPYEEYDSIFKDNYTNVIFALKNKNIIELMCCVKNISAPVEKRIFSELFSRLKRPFSQKELYEIDKKYYEEIEIRDRENYIKFAVDNSNSYIKSIDKLLGEAIDEIGNIQKDLAEKMRMYNQYNEILNNFNREEHYKNESDKALINYEATRALNKVKSIFVKDEFVNVYTHNIYCQDPRDKVWHDIGTFHIRLAIHSTNFDPSRSILIKNTKHQIRGYSERVMEAPHVFHEGNMCAGNLVTAVTEHYKNRDLYGLVLDIIGFLESCNVDDGAGSHINKWPEVSEEEALAPTENIILEDIINLKEDVKTVDEFDKILNESIPV